ncbi:hypothetical protein Salmi_Mp083 (mitochondrion) [Salvia miltiorrhiza]|uniref:Secreted protein n=1 Tax=Salvia miltiorrhiza TaxID=226208 RepID=V9P4Z8_SALMI|nr:hypothetical protein Salmi_Mp083 [Salvia miltiorrhiza]AGU16611.1 hypothetical protein Salmi_Mp083 [Salvia miltiorrhiza]
MLRLLLLLLSLLKLLLFSSFLDINTRARGRRKGLLFLHFLKRWILCQWNSFPCCKIGYATLAFKALFRLLLSCCFLQSDVLSILVRFFRVANFLTKPGFF